MSTSYERKKIIVTGGAGFIGSHVTELLISKSYKVAVIDNFLSGRPENLQNVLNHPSLSLHEVDITNGERLKPVFEGAWGVIHLAGVADIVPSIRDPETYFQINVNGTFNVLEAARAAGCGRFVYAASSTCYGIPSTYPTPEHHRTNPQYPYALTKHLGEQLVMHWSSVYGLHATSLRLFNVYGARVRTGGSYGAVMGVFLAQRANNKPLTIVGDGKQTRDFTHVKDVAKAFLLALENVADGVIFNVGSGTHRSVNDLASIIGGPVCFLPRRPGEPDTTFADITAITETLCWKPEICFEDGVKELITDLTDWKSAPLWDPDSIAKATADWFEHLQ